MGKLIPSSVARPDASRAMTPSVDATRRRWGNTGSRPRLYAQDHARRYPCLAGVTVTVRALERANRVRGAIAVQGGKVAAELSAECVQLCL